MSTPSPEMRSFAVRSRWWRWSIAVSAILVVGVVGTAAGWYGDICEQQLSAAGTVATVCHPPGLSDLQVLAAGLVILLLLWPDLSEVSIGVVRLKRLVEEKAEETGEKVDTAARETERRIENLRFELRADLSQAMIATQTINIWDRMPDYEPDEIAEVAKRQWIAESGGQVPDSWRFEGFQETLDKRSLFLVDWVVAEAVLEWADRGRVYRTDGDLSYLSRHPGLLLGLEIPPERVFDTAVTIDITATSYADALVAARSARNLMAHDAAQNLDEGALSGLIESLQRFVGAVRRRVAASL